MKIKAISISDTKGVRKINVDQSKLVVDFGLENDAHGGKWHRQVSLLAEESIDFMRKRGLDVVAGNFAENITTEGLDLINIPVGTHIKIGDTEMIISQIGKVCHNKCQIYELAGDCVMPREGVFAIVIKGGIIAVNDPITILDKHSSIASILCTAKTEREYGEQLENWVKSTWAPAVFRFDNFYIKKNNLPAMIKDLTTLQNVDNVLVFDPEKNHVFNLSAFGDEVEQGLYNNGKTKIHYRNSMEDL